MNMMYIFICTVAHTPEKAKETAEKWLIDVLNDLEHVARTGLRIEITEAVNPQ